MTVASRTQPPPVGTALVGTAATGLDETETQAQVLLALKPAMRGLLDYSRTLAANESMENKGGDRDPVTAPEAANDDEPVPLSLDGDASDRTLDWQLA